MIVGETLAGIFLLGSFFASFFTGPQRGSQTCTKSFQELKKKNKEKRAETVSRDNRLGPFPNKASMVASTKRYLGNKAIPPRKYSTKSSSRRPTRGGMGNLNCLLRFIRSAFRDYDVEFDGVVINDLDDKQILIIINNFLTNHKKELVDIVQNELDGSISNKEVMDKINSIQNDISKRVDGSLKSLK